MTMTPEDLLPHFRSAWGPDTCYPDSREEWTPRNPSRDQCGMTALVVQDVLGGDLVLAEVHVDGVKVGHHYWNRLPDGSDVDLTGDQFLPQEEVVGGTVVIRPPEGPRRHREQYELLRRRVLDSLALAQTVTSNPRS
jgi:hypothetical protein